MVPDRRVPFRAGGTPRGVPLFGTAPQTFLADVSEFQPNINDAAYLSFSKAIAIRAMYGDAHDDGAWYGGARRADLWRGGAQVMFIYQYVTAFQDAAAQAEALVRLLGPLREGEMPVADLEEGGGNQAGRLAAWRAVIHKAYPWLLETPSAHAWCYSGQQFAFGAGLDPDWLADYTGTEPAAPPHRMWQFTDSYPVPGVGTADCSLFHGTVAELRALITPKPSPVTVTGKASAMQLTGSDNTVHVPATAKVMTLNCSAPENVPMATPTACRVQAGFHDQWNSAQFYDLAWGTGEVKVKVTGWPARVVLPVGWDIGQYPVEVDFE